MNSERELADVVFEKILTSFPYGAVFKENPNGDFEYIVTIRCEKDSIINTFARIDPIVTIRREKDSITNTFAWVDSHELLFGSSFTPSVFFLYPGGFPGGQDFSVNPPSPNMSWQELYFRLTAIGFFT